MSHPRSTPFPLLTLALAATLMVSSCRNLPVSPQEGLALGGTDPAATPGYQGAASRVPVIIRIRTEVRGDSLYVLGVLGSSTTCPAVFYDPARAGGWALQFFMNTDQADTGYPWQGLDYLVRGGEWLSDGSFVVRRVEADYDGPGDWGPRSGVARITPGPRSVVIAVPLAAIGNDDGRLDFVLETYATVACAGCERGVSQVLVADYVGSTTGPRRGGLLAGAAPEAGAIAARAFTRPLAHLGGRAASSDTDARW